MAAVAHERENEQDVDAHVLWEAVERLEARAAELADQRRGLLRQASEFRLQAEKATRAPLRFLPKAKAHKGKPVSLKDLEAVAEVVDKLAPCTTAMVADHLGVSENIARSRLTRLEELQRVRREGLRAQTRWFPAEEGEVSQAPSRDADAESVVRDAARELGSFTLEELAEKAGLSRHTVQRWVKAFMERGWFDRERVGKEFLYEYVPPARQHAPRTRQATPEQLAHASAPAPRRGGGPSGRRLGAVRPDVRVLIREAEDAGATVRKTNGNHYQVIYRDKVIGSIPGTPSDHRSLRNCRAELRRGGMSV